MLWVLAGLSAVGRADQACLTPTSAFWIEQFGTSGHDLSRFVAVNPADEGVYITGYTTGQFPNQSPTHHPAGWDAFLARYSPDGTQVWIKQFGAGDDDRGMAVAPSPCGTAVYVAGGTSGTFFGQPQVGGASDVFIAKYATNGEKKWIKQFGSDGADYGYGLAIHHSSGDLYISGSTWGTLPGQQNHGSIDALVARLNAEGEVIWAKQFGTSTGDSAPAIAVDDDSNAYIAGYTTGTFPGQEFAGVVDAFLAKYSPAGEQLWLKQFGSSGATAGRGVVVDSCIGAVYVTGHTGAAFPGKKSMGGFDAYLAKFTTDGDKLWVRQFGTAGHDEGLGIALDEATGDVFVSGSAAGTFEGAPPGKYTGGTDAFVARFTSDGELIWVTQFGSDADDVGWSISPAPSASGQMDLYIVGRTSGSFAGHQNMCGLDGFLAKVPACEPSPLVPGDLTGNGSVGVPDLLILLAAWGPCPPPCPADLTGSGVVGVADVLILLANWTN